MTIQQLDSKYSFNWLKISKDANTAYLTALHFGKGETGTVRTAAAIINALPITEQERQELINSMFERKGN